MKRHYVVLKQTWFFLFVSFCVMPQIYAQTTEQRLQRLEQMANSRGQLQADMMLQINELQQKVRDLSGLLEVQQHKLKQMQERQRDLYRDIERRLSNVNSNQTAQKPEMPSSSAGHRQNSQDDNELEQYNKIMPLVRAKKYAEAVTAYQSYLERFPQGKFSANANYWLGQVYFVQGKTDSAQMQYEKLIKQFPDYSNTGMALVNLGEIYLLQGKTGEAKKIWEKVITGYTGNAKHLASEALRKLK